MNAATDSIDSVEFSVTAIPPANDELACGISRTFVTQLPKVDTCTCRCTV